MKLFTETASIRKAITSIGNRGAKLDGDIHVAGVSVLAHIAAHSDTTLADALVHAMPKGGRKLALVEWMLAHGQIVLLDKSEAKDTGRIFKLDRERTFDKEGAIATPWVEFRKEASVHTAFDAGAAITSVIKRLRSASAKGLTVENKEQASAEAQALLKLLEA